MRILAVLSHCYCVTALQETPGSLISLLLYSTARAPRRPHRTVTVTRALLWYYLTVTALKEQPGSASSLLHYFKSTLAFFTSILHNCNITPAILPHCYRTARATWRSYLTVTALQEHPWDLTSLLPHCKNRPALRSAGLMLQLLLLRPQQLLHLLVIGRYKFHLITWSHAQKKNQTEEKAKVVAAV